MMINTFKFSKGLIISIIYIVIILTFVKCAGPGTSGSGTDDNKKQPVPDFEPGGVDDKNYFQYHFRSTYPGRLKLSPKHYFASKYGCPFIVLPNLKYINIDPQNVGNEYEYYIDRIYKEKKYEDRLKKLRDIYNQIEIEDNAFAQAIKKTYEATKTAYITVHDNFENNVNEEELENTKNDAIKNYLRNQMSISTLRSTIPVKYEEIDFFYVINNYELYIDPTEEILYRKKVIKEEISALEVAIKSIIDKNCHPLRELEFYEVTFLYDFLPNEDDDCKDYEEMKILVALNLQECLNNSKLTYQHDDFLVPNIVNDTYSYEDLCKKMKSNYVVGNENFMSYLVRLKAQGYIGIHQTLHEFMYAVRLNEYGLISYYIDNSTQLSKQYIIDMDFLHEPSEKQEIQPIKNMLAKLQEEPSEKQEIQPIEDDSDITNN